MIAIASGGIQVWNARWSIISGDGVLTSADKGQEFINIVMYTATRGVNADEIYGFRIESVLAGGMGLRISKPGSDRGSSVTYLRGDQSNTFRGHVEISGRNNYLSLGKSNGAIAVSGDILVRDGAVVRFDESQQVNYTSKITLENSALYYSIAEWDLRVQFHRLRITGNLGVVSFGSQGTHSYKRYLYLDELVIERNAHLEVGEWAPERDFLLVRKTMNKDELDALMRKIIFRGWLPGRTHLEDYDKDYWAISGTPEPETYGAILGAVGLGLAVFRNRRNGAR